MTLRNYTEKSWEMLGISSEFNENFVTEDGGLKF